jgi:hypothetical protein
MTTTVPFLLEETNLSSAWYKAMNIAILSKNNEITPLILSLTGFEQTKLIRDILDADLLSNKMASVHTVSETIFPDSLY